MLNASNEYIVNSGQSKGERGGTALPHLLF